MWEMCDCRTETDYSSFPLVFYFWNLSVWRERDSKLNAALDSFGKCYVLWPRCIDFLRLPIISALVLSHPFQPFLSFLFSQALRSVFHH